MLGILPKLYVPFFSVVYYLSRDKELVINCRRSNENILFVSEKPKTWVSRWGRRVSSPASDQRQLSCGTAAARRTRSRENVSRGRDVLPHLVIAPTQVFGEPARCRFLGSDTPHFAADTVISIPLAAAFKLLKTLIIGLMVQKLTMEGTKAAKITAICFSFRVIVQKRN